MAMPLTSALAIVGYGSAPLEIALTCTDDHDNILQCLEYRHDDDHDHKFYKLGIVLFAETATYHELACYLFNQEFTC